MGPRLFRPAVGSGRSSTDDGGVPEAPRRRRNAQTASESSAGLRGARQGRLLFASITVGDGAKNVVEPVAKTGSAELPNRTRFPQLSLPLWVTGTGSGDSDSPLSKSRLMTVQDFFKYTNLEGRRFFDELDRDGDGRVTLQDVKAAMRKRNLPPKYAKDFMNRVRRDRWWQSSIGWEDFKSLVDEREAEMLRAFTSLELSTDGHLKMGGIKESLKKVGLPATTENATAMLSALETSPDGLITYGKFRNFALLLPKDRIIDEMDPAVTWFESATMFNVAPPVDENSPAKVVATAALAGALASGTSTFALHPLDTLKTRLQASVKKLGLVDMIREVPKIGSRNLYRGIIPASAGAAASHGVRTGAYELSLMILKAFSGGALELQATGLASGVGTLMGTAIRIPCEVLKQRLQVGTHQNTVEAFRVATETAGVKGLFRGTAATLGREVPFYVLGMVGYEQLKKLASGELLMGASNARELTSAETIAVGALSGAVAAVLTTPADVMKTRIMTLPAGTSVNFGQMVLDLAQKEGFGAFFKGCLPRGLWIAPLGAMNFAGYELAKKAMLNKKEDLAESPAEKASLAISEEAEAPTAAEPPRIDAFISNSPDRKSDQ